MSAYSLTSSTRSRRDHFGDDRQTRLRLGRAQDAEAFFAHPLEAVRRGARLERAAAQDRRARSAHRARRGSHLVGGFHRARSRHDDEVLPADLDPVDLDDRVVRLELAADHLVGLADRDDLLDAVARLQETQVRAALGLDDADDRAVRAPGRMGLEPQLFDRLDDAADLGDRRVGLH